MRPITRTKIFFLADGKTEALTVYERTHYKDPADRTHDVVSPSRRKEFAKPEWLREYAAAWNSAADWIASREIPFGVPSEVVDDITECVSRGHSGQICVDLEAWKFCTGLRFAVERAEAQGVTREQIKAIYLAAIKVCERT